MGAAVGVVAGVIGGGGGGMLGGLLGGSGLLGGLGQLLGGFLGGSNKIDFGKVLEGFSPANVINATANLINSISGNSGKQAVDKLAKEDGLPKFLQEAIKKVIDEVVKKFEKKADPEAEKALKDAAGSDVQKSIDDLAQKIVDAVRKNLEENQKDDTASNRTGGSGKGGKKSTGSWLMAIAKAMGEVLGEKASKMVELSGKISDAADAQKSAGKDQKAQQEAAADMTKAQTEMQGVSQEYKLPTETFSTVIKGIGESLSTMGRKQ